MRILVAGIGNTLRGDDGFGIEVVRRLQAEGGLAPDVRLLEFGIAGISFVQELMSLYDALILVDAVDRKAAPGTLCVLEPKLPAMDTGDPGQLARMAGDPHQTDPFHALILARALKVLPRHVVVIGCQPVECDELGAGLSPAVEAAVSSAWEKIISCIEGFYKPLPTGS